MQTTQTPSIADLRVAMAKTLHSAAFAKFMGQAVQAAFAELQNQPTDIRLAPKPTTKVKFSDTGCACSYQAQSTDHKSVIRMQRAFENIEHPEYRHHWYGSASHTDHLGRVWSNRLPNMVQDDFGVLVEVPE